MLVSVAHDFLPKRLSLNAAVVMGHFGVGFEAGRHVIAEGLDLPIEAGDVVCFTGESGAGKSSLMRAAAEELRRAGSDVLDLDALPPECGLQSERQSRIQPGSPKAGLQQADGVKVGVRSRVLVDVLELPVEESMRLLASCGLGEAQLMLRTPAELSDGQRYRFLLARALSKKPRWIVADEFTATLDRTLARVIAYNVRRSADRTGTGFLLATTHEDILDDLQPSLHVRCRLDGRLSVVREPCDRVKAGLPAITGKRVKKKRSAWRTSCGSVAVPSATGRTSLGGITGATRSARCDS